MLYIMRHGKTDWNVIYKLQGSVDIPLNEEGRQMAREAAVKYQDVKFDICFVSPLVRARETAQILLKGRDVPIVVDERLREMSFGEYEGTEQIFSKPQCPMYKLFKDPANYVADRGAESLEELYARTGEFLNQKVKPLLEQGKDVLILGHGAMNCSIVNQCKNIPVDRFWSTGIPNCELITIL